MDPRRFDTVRAQQPFQRELDDLLRFTNHIGPALPVEEHVQRLEPNLGASDVIGGKTDVAHHQAASVQ